MGRYTYTDICPYVANLGARLKFLNIDFYTNRMNKDEADVNFIKGTQWRQVWEAAEAGKKKRLLVDTFALIENKKCYVIHVVNEHQYSNGGGQDFTIFAATNKEFDLIKSDAKETNANEDPNSYLTGFDLDGIQFAGQRESVEKFLATFMITDVEIEDSDSVQQTL